MIKMKKSFASLFMAMVMMVAFCVPSFAAEAEVKVDTFNAKDGIVTVSFPEEEEPTARFPGQAGLYGVKAHPFKSSTSTYLEDVYSYSLGNGRTQYLHVTLDSSTRNTYNSWGADGYLAEVDINVSTATRYDVKLNGESVGGGSCAGRPRMVLGLAMYDERPAIWEVTLYDNTTQGKPLWGHIYYN